MHAPTRATMLVVNFEEDELVTRIRFFFRERLGLTAIIRL